MAITERNRKLLWGRSGNRCAICRKELVIDATESDDESIIGEECHINSKQKTGPRYNDFMDKVILDSYENLILLCRVHHKMVDDQVTEYSEKKIKEIKKKHERWVKESLEEGIIKPIRLRSIKGQKVELLYRIVSGKQLFRIIDRACGAYTDHPEPENEIEVELFGGFLQSIQDWSDISGDLEQADRVKASYQIARELKELEEAGFWVFGNSENKVLEGGIDGPSSWQMAYINIVRNDSPHIINLNSE